jgi:hypothetical protein
MALASWNGATTVYQKGNYMAIFKGKAKEEGKHESIFHDGKVICTIKGTFQTEDKGLIDVLTTLGYEQLDAPQESVTPVEPSEVSPEAPVTEGSPQKRKGKSAK